MAVLAGVGWSGKNAQGAWPNVLFPVPFSYEYILLF